MYISLREAIGMTGAEALMRELIDFAHAMEAEAMDDSLPDRQRMAAANVGMAARAYYSASALLDIHRERYNVIVAPGDPSAN